MQWSSLSRVALITPLIALGLASCTDAPTSASNGGQPVRHIDEEGNHHSHWRFGHLSWVPRTDLGPNVIEFRYRNSYRRSGYRGTAPDGRPAVGDFISETVGGTTLCFNGRSTCTPTLRYVVTSINVAEDWLVAEALHPGTNDVGVRHTYSAPGTYRATSYSCCRIGSLRNGANGDYGVATTVHVGTGNRSPVSNMVPIVTVGHTGNQTWTIPAADADGDQLRFRMATPTEAGGGGIAQPPGMTVDPTSGVVTWNTGGAALGPYWTQQIIEELDAAGNVKGFVAVDYIVNVVETVGTNRPPAFTAPSCNGMRSILVGETANISVSANDPDAGNTVNLFATGLPPGATFTQTAGNPATGTLSWSPLTSQTGPHVVTFSAQDNNGAQTLCSYTLLASFQMDVWPGSISLSRTPMVWAVVLSTADFNALTMDLSTVRLGDGSGADTPIATRAGGPYVSEKDFNNDGRMDRALFFSVPQLRTNGDLYLGQTQLVLRGNNTATGQFRGVPRTMPTITP